MTDTYLARAKLNLLDLLMPEIPRHLPVKFGAFTMNHTPLPNHARVLQEYGFDLRGEFGLDPEKLPPLDDDYPLSLLYIDMTIEVEEPKDSYVDADDTLEQLEASFRLFQEGYINIRRHKMWRRENDSWVPDFEGLILDTVEPREKLAYRKGEFRLKGSTDPKAEVIPSYGRQTYCLDDDSLGKFVEFFNSYWDTVHQQPMPLNIAISRFSSSYEKRTLADRFMDLMIAMEALFGEKGELTYKIALRSACLLYPPGEARERAFNTIKRLYDERSDIVHGRSLTSKSDEVRIDQFEHFVRGSIVRFLQLYKDGHRISSGAELDKLLFFTGSDSDQA